MSRLNLLLIPNFWLPRRQEGGPARTGCSKPQLQPSMPAVEARSKMRLRPVSLLLVRGMARLKSVLTMRNRSREAAL